MAALGAGDARTASQALERAFNAALGQARRDEAAGTLNTTDEDRELTERLFADMGRNNIPRPVHGDENELPAPASVRAYASVQRHLEQLARQAGVQRSSGEAGNVPTTPSWPPAAPGIDDYTRIAAGPPEQGGHLQAGSIIAPGSSWSFPANERGWRRPLSIEDGEVERFNVLDRRFSSSGLNALEPTEADQLYEHQVRRWHTQLGRLQELTNYVDQPEGVGEPLYSDFFRSLRETSRRRIGIEKLELARHRLGFPAGGWPRDSGQVFERADKLAIQMLRGRRLQEVSGDESGHQGDAPLSVSYATTGMGRAATSDEMLPLPNTLLPPEEASEPLYIRISPGMAASGLRRSIEACAHPVLLYDEADPPTAGALVLNWGDPQWQPPEGIINLNSEDAVAGVRDKLSCVEQLADLAPHTTVDPVEALEQFGAVMVGKSRRGQSGSGVGFIQDPAGGEQVRYADGTRRPIGAIPATTMNSYDLYQEHLPNRDEYRALMLDGQMVTLYHRVPEGTTADQPRPASFNYEQQDQVAGAALSAAREAMERTGLDFGGVDLVYDRESDRWLVFEVNSAPGLSAHSLDLLYSAVQNRLQGRCSACGQWIGNGAHDCPTTSAADVQGQRSWISTHEAHSNAPGARLSAGSSPIHSRQHSSSGSSSISSTVHPNLADDEGDTLIRGWIEQAQAMRAAGQAPAYRYEAALGQAAVRFGLELEFGAADADQVARALFEAGLAAHPEMMEHRHDCPSCRARWRVERDGSITQAFGNRSIGGEVISPVLEDKTTSWEAIEQVTRLLRHEGARVDVNAGQHVHVSTAAYGRGDEEYLHLVQRAAYFEDLLFRLAAPDVPLHRGLLRADRDPYFYTRSLAGCLDECYRRAAKSPGVIDVLQAFSAYDHEVGHYYALNLEHVPRLDPGGAVQGIVAGKHSHVEFRLPNATLDPAQIQTNVRIAAGLISIPLSAHTRVSERSGSAILRALRPVGWHRGRIPDEEHQQLKAFLNETMLPADACLAIVDTFLRSRWQPAAMPRDGISAAIAAYSRLV